MEAIQVESLLTGVRTQRDLWEESPFFKLEVASLKNGKVNGVFKEDGKEEKGQKRDQRVRD